MKTLAVVFATALAATAHATTIHLNFDQHLVNIKSVIAADPIQTEGFKTLADIHARLDMDTAKLTIDKLDYHSMPAIDETRELLLSFTPTTATLEKLDRISGEHFEGPVELIDQFGNVENMLIRVKRFSTAQSVFDSILSFGGERLHNVQFDPFAPHRDYWTLGQFSGTVPEPSTTTLLAVAMAVFPLRRRRFR